MELRECGHGKAEVTVGAVGGVGEVEHYGRGG